MRAVILILLMTWGVGGAPMAVGSPAWANDEGATSGSDALQAPSSGDEVASGAGDSLDGAGSAYCGALARQCGVACQATTEPGSAASAACQARCAVERAACETRGALGQVEPWLDEKTERMDRFMEGLEPDPETGERLGAPTQEVCEASHDRCMTRCEDRFDDDYARAGCVGACAMDRAACETAAGVETARPLIEREVQRLKDFLDALGGKDPASPPSLPPETIAPDDEGGVDL